MVERFARQGTFGNWTSLVPGRDSRFAFPDFLRMFISVPRLRKDLALGLIYNWTAGRARRPEGYSQRLIPDRAASGGKYTFFHSSFCDLVVWEALLAHARAQGDIPARYRQGALAAVDFALENGRAIPFEESSLTVFSYYPSRGHLVPPEHPAYKHFLSWDAGVPDNDSTCIVLGSLLRLLIDLGEPMERLMRPAGVMRQHLRLLKAHVHREGRYGDGFLSYASGVAPGDRGILTWIFDRHNELDPTSNINVLNFLSLLLAAGFRDLGAEIAELAGGILGFLRHHARAGNLFHPRLQQYYPPASSLLFWYRFLRNLDLLDAESRKLFDPGDAIGEIDAAIRSHSVFLFSGSGNVPNPSDAALASPYLQRAGIGIGDFSAPWNAPQTTLEHFGTNFYEVFHLLYPVQVICVTEALPIAAYLLFETERKRQSDKKRAAQIQC
ncbi:MAG: hypothetical protein JF616_07170 [Fibrobacteres bacterium]|nr:hypothetical protein [Fibrobacterota bacterium]